MGQTPYAFEGNLKSFTDQFYDGYLPFDSQFPEKVRHLIFSLIQINPRKRLTLAEVKEHPFILGESEMEGEKWWKCACDE